MASEETKTSRSSRRDLLIGVTGLAAVAAGWQLWLRRPREFEFEPIEGLAGWRRLVFDGISAPGGTAANAVFLGLDDYSDSVQPVPPSRLCKALFDNQSGKVPVAVFSDFFCPFCRAFIPRIYARERKPDSNISVTWHELPLLGPQSVLAAKAAIAAKLQNGYSEFQRVLAQPGFRPSQAYFASVASRAGLDANVLISDMDAPTVQSELDLSLGASRTLGVWGTPAMVVGRTLVMGQINDTELDQLISLEATANSIC